MDEIAVYLILSLAVFWVIKNNIGVFRGKSSCPGCTIAKDKSSSLKKGGCTGCPVSQLSKQKWNLTKEG
ncbi:MAG: hypothetical protein A3F16_01525 [Deltaproteobacteria bacterium RIFCSPHIGHO2_12_FULL_43_9]|nr:MAG: hypothetical protein A3F16_01525 [Deltaproteobacteria bacterium RIFCSPHIGHO2_12_FULL_43_9]